MDQQGDAVDAVFLNTLPVSFSLTCLPVALSVKSWVSHRKVKINKLKRAIPQRVEVQLDKKLTSPLWLCTRKRTMVQYMAKSRYS